MHLVAYALHVYYKHYKHTHTCILCKHARIVRSCPPGRKIVFAKFGNGLCFMVMMKVTYVAHTYTHTHKHNKRRTDGGQFSGPAITKMMIRSHANRARARASPRSDEDEARAPPPVNGVHKLVAELRGQANNCSLIKPLMYSTCTYLESDLFEMPLVFAFWLHGSSRARADLLCTTPGLTLGIRAIICMFY